MGCGCNKNSTFQNDISSRKSIKKNKLINKTVEDKNGNVLLVISNIDDVYGDTIGYITKNKSGETIRIFAKNIQKILD